MAEGSNSSFDWTWVVVALLIVAGLLGAVWLYNYGQAQQAEAYNDALSQSAQQVEDSTSALEQAITDLKTSIEGIGPDSGGSPPAQESGTETQSEGTGEGE
jgi:uncharacterized protein HemX